MKNKTSLYSLTFLLSFFILLPLISGCGNQGHEENVLNSLNQSDKPSTNQDVNRTIEKSTLKGFSLSPKSFGQDDFIDFFDKIEATSDIVNWAGNWKELADLEKGSPTVIMRLSSEYDYIPLIQASFYSNSYGDITYHIDQSSNDEFIITLSAFAEKYKPQYLGVGIEVNTVYEDSLERFDSFKSLFSQVYDMIKASSPETQVFTVFQLEKMKGLRGGLFGGENNPDNNQWHLLDYFNKADFISFTTYPCLIYKDPNDIPEDYYNEILNYTDKPVAFTEIGWFSDPKIPGWESSEDEQMRYIRRFSELTSSLKPKITLWSYMYDQEIDKPFETIGLFDRNGIEKQGWKEWIED